MINDGTKSYDHHRDGLGQIQGSCIRDFRNKPFPVRLKIEYLNQGLTVHSRVAAVLVVDVVSTSDLSEQWSLPR